MVRPVMVRREVARCVGARVHDVIGGCLRDRMVF